MAAGSCTTARRSFCRSTLPSAVVPGKAASMAGTAVAFIEFVDRRIGVVDAARRLPRTVSPSSICPFRSSRSVQESACRHPPLRFQTPSSPCPRRNASKRQQRQAEDGEMIAVDALEQVHAQSFELIGADAGRDAHRRPYPDRSGFRRRSGAAWSCARPRHRKTVSCRHARRQRRNEVRGYCRPAHATAPPPGRGRPAWRTAAPPSASVWSAPIT